MIKKKYILILFFVTHFNLGAQKIKAIINYKKEIIKEVVYGDNHKKKLGAQTIRNFQDFTKKLSDLEKKIVFQLKISGNESVFKGKPVLESGETNNSFYKAAIRRGNGVFYNNKNNRLRLVDTYGELFLISNPKLVWELKNETKIIGKYQCTKATTIKQINSKGEKVKVVAWFTSEIPIPFGPLGYAGLPGLILELEIVDRRYYTTKISLNPKEVITIKKPIKGINVTEKEYQEMASSTIQKFKKNNGY
jgi:GLPGLI family protein